MKNNKNRWWIKYLLAVCAIALCASASQAAFFSVNAGAENNADGFGGGRVFDQDGVTPLPVGCVVQYIYAGPDGTINSPAANGDITGDDVIIAVKSVGDDSVWLGFSNTAGQFYHGITGQYSSNSPKIYVRAWNASNIANATRYGNSALFSPNTDANNPPIPNEVGISNFSTSVSSTPPTITSIDWKEDNADNIKNKNYVYGTIQINGTNFGDDPGNGNRDTAQNSIKISGLTVPDVNPDSGIEVYFWSKTAIVCGVPLKVGGSYIAAGDLAVQVTASGLASNLDKTILVKPKVYGVNPTSGTAGTAVQITGTAFNTTAANNSVSFAGTNVNGGSITLNDTGAILTVNAPSIAAGQKALSVTVNGKTSNANYDWGAGDPVTFTITNPQPTVSAISPTVGTVGTSVDIEITGTNFMNGATAKLTKAGQSDINVNVSNVAAAKISGSISLPANAATGTWNVVVTNADQQFATLTNGFTVNAVPQPSLSAINPNSGEQGKTVDVVITGQNVNWSGDMKAQVHFSGNGITINSATGNGLTINANISIATDAPVGNRSCMVDNVAGSVTFSVTASTAPVAAELYNAGLFEQKQTKEAWVYATPYDPNYVDSGTQDKTLNLVAAGKNFGQNNADPANKANGNAPAGASIKVKIPGGSDYKTIPDNPNVPDRIYWWLDDKVEFALPAKFGSALVVAGSGKIKVVTSNGESENSFTVKPRIWEGAVVPAKGKAGDTITIKGTAFGLDTDKIYVNFGNSAVKPLSAEMETGLENVVLTVKVPDGVPSGTILKLSTTVNGVSGNEVSFEVTANPNKPQIAVTPTSVSFTAYKDGKTTAPSSNTITVKNVQAGTGSFNFTVSTSNDWLVAAPTSGTASDAVPAAVVLTINSLKIPAAEGTYEGTAQVTPVGDVQGGIQTVNVSLIVKEFTGPVITDVSPAAAPSGTQITVSGAAFGKSQGTSQLIFIKGDTSINAKVAFWSDSKIIAEVPSGLGIGAYDIKVLRLSIASEGIVIAAESNPSAFNLTALSIAGLVTAYPNPFNPNTQTISLQWSNPQGNSIGVYIYDMTARLVKREVLSSGSTQTSWNGLDYSGSLVGDSAYLIRVVNEDNKALIAKGKILVIKK